MTLSLLSSPLSIKVLVLRHEVDFPKEWCKESTKARDCPGRSHFDSQVDCVSSVDGIQLCLWRLN